MDITQHLVTVAGAIADIGTVVSDMNQYANSGGSFYAADNVTPNPEHQAKAATKAAVSNPKLSSGVQALKAFLGDLQKVQKAVESANPKEESAPVVVAQPPQHPKVSAEQISQPAGGLQGLSGPAVEPEHFDIETGGNVPDGA